MTRARLSGDERRSQILDAVLPVVLECGSDVTSKQLAEAAGVAEGTVFRAFGDKDSLLIALLERETGERLSSDDITAIRPSSLEDLVTIASALLVDRFVRVFRLFVVLGPLAARAPQNDMEEKLVALHAALETQFEPFREELRVPPSSAAEALRTLAFAASSNWGRGEAFIKPDDIAPLLLHGIVGQPNPATDPGQLLSAVPNTLP